MEKFQESLLKAKKNIHLADHMIFVTYKLVNDPRLLLSAIKNIKNDLTKIKGLGEKISDKLSAEGIVSFDQLAKLSNKELKALDGKIKGFAARYKRYEWSKQANELK